ncbi:MAG: hypothetical protein WCY36_08265 [Candidatus Omnitrophota bacterium]
MSYQIRKRKRLDWKVEAEFTETQHPGGGMSIGIVLGDENWLDKELMDLPPATITDPAWREHRRKIHEERERRWHAERLKRLNMKKIKK